MGTLRIFEDQNKSFRYIKIKMKVKGLTKPVTLIKVKIALAFFAYLLKRGFVWSLKNSN